MKYIAYGSNMNLAQMAFRCPTAKVVGKMLLEGYELNFRGRNGNCHATIDKKKGSAVPVLVWEIDKECERSLDWYEGYPTYYRKEYVSVDNEYMMVYIMNGGNIGYPTLHYYGVIEEGYNANGIATEPLEAALRRVDHYFRDGK